MCRAILADVRILVGRARRHCGIAHHAFAVLAVCGLLALRLEATVAGQQTCRRAVGVPDAAWLRAGISATGKGHRAVLDLQSVGVSALDLWCAADGQRTAAPHTANVYAPISDERSALNIHHAVAAHKYRAVLSSSSVIRIGTVRRDLDDTALHRQGAAYMDRLTAVGLHDLTDGAAVLNGQAAAVIDVKYSVQRDKAARHFGRLYGMPVQIQSNIASCQLDAVAITVSVFGDRHILQQLHRGALLPLRGGKRIHNVGVLRGRAASGDLRHICGICLRRDVIFRLRRPCGGGQERQAQGQCHEHTQYSFFHVLPP